MEAGLRRGKTGYRANKKEWRQGSGGREQGTGLIRRNGGRDQKGEDRVQG
jgi:hypothetical protein